MANRFAAAGIETAQLDARLLLGHALNLDGLGIAIKEKQLVSDMKSADVEILAQRRLAGEPVARIVGSKEFYGLEFGLNEATLVPRPETEMLVDLGLEILDNQPESAILDLGAGSGCIVISLLANLAGARGVGIDTSERALEQATKNAERHGVETRVEWQAGSWFAPLRELRFDLIVSNPPYIAGEEISDLQTEVREFDPFKALYGGEDGLDAYRAITGGAGGYLHPGGTLLLEVGFNQMEAVANLCRQNHFRQVKEKRDLAGHSRVIVAQY